MAQFTWIAAEQSDASEFVQHYGDTVNVSLVSYDGQDAVEMFTTTASTGIVRLGSVAQATDFDLVYRSRGPDSLSNAFSHGGAVRIGSDGLGYGAAIWGSLRLMKHTPGSSSLESTSATTTERRSWWWTRITITGSSLLARFWEGALEDENDTREMTATDSSYTSPAFAGVRTINGIARFTHFYVGTDGDPAPTEPLGGAEPFLLRHNPRTNKVIPVLSSPTVTDIGATCVRPRVTKGF